MYTSSSNHSSQFGNFLLLCGEIVGVERKRRKDPRRPTFFFFFSSSSYKNRTIHDVDNVESSHLIKLVHAVQSLKREKKKNCTYVTP